MNFWSNVCSKSMLNRIDTTTFPLTKLVYYAEQIENIDKQLEVSKCLKSSPFPEEIL